MAEPAKPFLIPALGSHMVLQREKPTTFGGWTKPGSTVTVSIDGQQYKAKAGTDGKWDAKVTPPKVGGPYTISIDGPEHMELTDVLVGDVWLCGGQSNMEFGIGGEKDGAAEIAQADHPNIRLFIDSHQVAASPRAVNGGAWTVCSPQTVGQGGWNGFSAVGYHFGRKLQQELNIPIGLVSVNWGGTPAEAWTSAASLERLGDFDSGLAVIREMRAGKLPEAGSYFDLWSAQSDVGSRPDAQWQRPDLDESQWVAADANNGFEAQGNPEGIVWYRKAIEVPAAATGVLHLGPIEQIDQTWVNGQMVGGSGWGPWPREYYVRPDLLKAGKNVITIRVIGRGEKRGFQSPPAGISLVLADGTHMPLGEGWKVRLGTKISAQTPGPRSYDQFPNIPTVLFNGMLSPHLVQGIRGAIWYQGEANASRAWQYRTLLPTMIADWRRAFGQGDFPFYIVSLSAFTPRRDQPGEDEWAELREAQAYTASTVPNSGLAVTIDVGDAKDIHPTDKMTVGERLALIALSKEYGKSVVCSGPVYRQMKRDGATVRLSFDHTDGGLSVHGDKLGEFSVAGADRKWRWADAKIDGNDVVISCPEIPEPVAVRYAWQTNPLATLFNGAGLPAVPFRTDDWPASTAGRK